MTIKEKQVVPALVDLGKRYDWENFRPAGYSIGFYTGMAVQPSAHRFLHKRCDRPDQGPYSRFFFNFPVDNHQDNPSQL